MDGDITRNWPNRVYGSMLSKQQRRSGEGYVSGRLRYTAVKRSYSLPWTPIGSTFILLQEH